MLPQHICPLLRLSHVVGQSLKVVARDFYLRAWAFAPSHTGMVAEDAENVDGRVSVKGVFPTFAARKV